MAEFTGAGGGTFGGAHFLYASGMYPQNENQNGMKTPDRSLIWIDSSGLAGTIWGLRDLGNWWWAHWLSSVRNEVT